MLYITEAGVKYRIRGPLSASQLRALYQRWRAKYPGTETTFAGWLVGFGKVYNRVRSHSHA